MSKAQRGHRHSPVIEPDPPAGGTMLVNHARDPITALQELELRLPEGLDFREVWVKFS